MKPDPYLIGDYSLRVGLVVRSKQALARFFLEPASPLPLAILRIGLSLILILQGLMIAPALLELYGRDGVLQGPLLDYLMMPFGTSLPSLNWLPATVEIAGHAISGNLWLVSAFYLYMASLVFLLFGCRTRLAAVVAVGTHWLLLGAGFWSSYGADRFAQIALFYFIWMPVAAVWSMDARNSTRSRGETGDDPYPLARLSLRILQLHLCIVYLSTALAKSRGHEWWSGEAIWYALMSYGLPVVQTSALKLAPWSWVFKLLSWSTLVIEFAYAILVWPRLTRRWIVGGICALHLGIALSLGLISFSLIMICLTAAAFAVPPGLEDFERLNQRISMSAIALRTSATV